MTRGYPKFTPAETLCLNVASDILTTDCQLHFHHVAKSGLDRHPQIHNNTNHLQVQKGSNLSQSIYNLFVQGLATTESVYSDSATAA